MRSYLLAKLSTSSLAWSGTCTERREGGSNLEKHHTVESSAFKGFLNLFINILFDLFGSYDCSIHSIVMVILFVKVPLKILCFFQIDCRSVCQQLGQVRALGVSNFGVRHLTELLADGPSLPIAVNEATALWNIKR